MQRPDERAWRRAASDLGASGAGEGATHPRPLGGFSAAHPAPVVLGRSTCRSGGSAVACGRTEGAEPVWDLPGDRLEARSEH
eukprot:1433078-Prymnesium_polylepis.1